MPTTFDIHPVITGVVPTGNIVDALPASLTYNIVVPLTFDIDAVTISEAKQRI